MSDYLELPLYLEQDQTVDLWVYLNPKDFIIIKHVNADPVHLHGWWSIPFIQYNRYATAHLEASKVMYFVTIDKDKINEI